MRCADCNGGCFKRECLMTVQHQEDRLHMARHDEWSHAIGAPMPQSRAQRKRVEKEKGVYFDSQLTPDEKRYKEYAEHVRAGGQRINSSELVPKPPDTKHELKERIMTSWRKHGVVTD